MKPALTPEEWATALGRSTIRKSSEIESAREKYAVYWLEGGGGYLQGIGGASHGAAAMLLYGEPFGFTREDVAVLREAAGAVVYRDAFSGQLASDPVASRKLLDTADRIEALLPPEEP